jgi:glutamine---fructose-6-phosphate transaminase (isomerizing)
LLLCAAGSINVDSACDPLALISAADVTSAWLASDGLDAVRDAAERIARRRSIIYTGSGFGAPVANELALKLREAAYLSADGLAAGEFRHGSTAMLDASFAVVGIVDDATRDIVRRPLEAAALAESARFVIGEPFDGITGLGPRVPEAWETLGWLITGQLIALYAGRARGVNSDAPRGLVKSIR